MDNWSDLQQDFQQQPGIPVDFLFQNQSDITSSLIQIEPEEAGDSPSDPFSIRGEAIRLKTLAAISAQKEEYELAIAYAFDAATRFHNLNIVADRLECLFIIGQSCLKIKDFVRGYVSFNKLLEESKKENQLQFELHAILGLGKIYLGRGALHKAKAAFLEIKDRIQAEPQLFEAETPYQIELTEPIFLLAQTALQLESYGEAIQYGNRVTELSGYNSLLRCHARLIVAIACIKIGKLARATTLLINNLSFLKGIGHPIILIETHQIYGDLLFHQQNFSKAKSHYLKGLTLAEKEDLKSLMRQAHRSLSKLYKADGDFEKALYHFETFYNLSDIENTESDPIWPKLYP